MLTVSVEIVGPLGAVTRKAVVDTGFSAGLYMAPELARSLGAILVSPLHPVVAADGRRIPGFATVLRVNLPKAGVGDETYVFCPRSGTKEILVGALLLGQVRAALTIGKVTLRFPSPTRASRHSGDLIRTVRAGKKLDIGRVVIPIRPVTAWWK